MGDVVETLLVGGVARPGVERAGDRADSDGEHQRPHNDAREVAQQQDHQERQQHCAAEQEQDRAVRVVQVDAQMLKQAARAVALVVDVLIGEAFDRLVQRLARLQERCRYAALKHRETDSKRDTVS